MSHRQSPDPIEARLMLVAEMLDRAIEELDRVMTEIKQVRVGGNGHPEPEVPSG